MVRVSFPTKLRPWSELTAKMVMGVVPGLVKIACQEAAKWGVTKWGLSDTSASANCPAVPEACVTTHGHLPGAQAMSVAKFG